MDSVHDMGGMHGFGRVPFEQDEPAFHDDWERRVWGMRRGAMRAPWGNLDYSRHGLEKMPPDLYLSYSYFERWLYGLTTAMLEAEFVTLDEVMQGKAGPESVPRDDAPGPESANPYARPVFRRDIDAAARFQPGNRVRTGNPHPAGHTRLPRYARDKVGHVHLHHGAHVLPDTNAHGKGECPTHLYTVAFAARDLWGPEASAKDQVFVDVWECHLEPA